jgi:heterogeneous nuclear ribonucleoprotein M
MGLAMGGGGHASLDCVIEMKCGNLGERYPLAEPEAMLLGWPGRLAKYLRNFTFDFTWKMLKDKFTECGHVLYADIKMENGKSKGYGYLF